MARKIVIAFFVYLTVLSGCAYRASGGGRANTQYDQYAVTGNVMRGRTEEELAGAPPSVTAQAPGVESRDIAFNTESYSHIVENTFLKTIDNPLSTFSIDVDTASYANVRRFLTANNMLPYPDAVRIEEMINYFKYDYPEPTGSDPFSFTTEVTTCPWNTAHKLVLIGLQAKKVDLSTLPPNNLVFLLDVSGSMDEPNKLPLLKEALALLVNEMRPIDTVSIVVYAGAAGVVLEPTSCESKEKILGALGSLQAGGSTAGGAGIQLAYKLAKEHFNAQGNNRVILATDGDFNVGPSSEGELVRMIEEKRREGIYLTVLGFGTGNYQDSKMEMLADKGNGNYAYIDTLLEAKKVLVEEMGGTLLTIAKDVKIQIEFNPALVDSYRLIGYENRVMRSEDFTNDLKDAGELGAGHNVTALYEIIMAGPGSTNRASTRYQDTQINPTAYENNEIMMIKFRYKPPTSDTSLLIEKPIVYSDTPFANASLNIRWAASVAEFGMLLRKSEFLGNATYDHLLGIARPALGQNPDPYRQEFIKLVEIAKKLAR